MNITRHNYEEYFILYMDNELSSEDRRLVELFVQENTDLKEELDWLLQSRLVPDTSLVFENKAQLVKSSGAESINEANYETWLLLYTDDELTTEQKISVEKFAAAHPSIQDELELLQKTKLYPEKEIVFADKELLYRNNEKVRVIAISWRRIAVAAALLFAIATTAIILLNKNIGGTNPGIAAEKNPALRSTPVNPEQKVAIEAQANPMASENNNDQPGKEKPVLNNPVATVDKKNVLPLEKNNRSSVLPIKEDPPVIADINPGKQKTNNLPDAGNNPNVNEGLRNDNMENTIARADILENNALTKPTENIQVGNVTPGNSQSLNNVVAAVSVESIDPADAEPGKKNKLRGFFRKVTRTFEKRTNIKATDDEDRLLLGGLAIKL